MSFHKRLTNSKYYVWHIVYMNDINANAFLYLGHKCRVCGSVSVCRMLYVETECKEVIRSIRTKLMAYRVNESKA